MKKERDLAKIAKDAKRGRRRPRARFRNFVFFLSRRRPARRRRMSLLWLNFPPHPVREAILFRQSRIKRLEEALFEIHLTSSLRDWMPSAYAKGYGVTGWHFVPTGNGGPSSRRGRPAFAKGLRRGRQECPPSVFKSVLIREIRGFFLSSLSVSSVISVVFLLSPFVINRT